MQCWGRSGEIRLHEPPWDTTQYSMWSNPNNIYSEANSIDFRGTVLEDCCLCIIHTKNNKMNEIHCVNNSNNKTTFLNQVELLRKKQVNVRISMAFRKRHLRTSQEHLYRHVPLNNSLHNDRLHMWQLSKNNTGCTSLCTARRPPLAMNWPGDSDSLNSEHW